MVSTSSILYFFFNDTATTEIYTLSLHDALPISFPALFSLRLLFSSDDRAVADDGVLRDDDDAVAYVVAVVGRVQLLDRKSTRLNSSHANISYAVFCLKKKKKHYLNNLSNTTKPF